MNYLIEYNGRHGLEIVDEAATLEEAEYLAHEYSLAFNTTDISIREV